MPARTGVGLRIRLSDGRHLTGAVFGDPSGRPVFYFHGFPASHLEAVLGHPIAQRLGVRLIALDRPGLGGSSRQPGRVIADWPTDVAEVAQALGLATFSILGISGGGPYALACAAALGPRIEHLAVVCGMGPVACQAGLASMRRLPQALFAGIRRHPGPTGAFVRRLLGPTMQGRPDLLLAPIHWHHPTSADATILRSAQTAALFMHSFRESFRQGVAGPAHELFLLAHPWGFDPAAIRIPVGLWHGRDDHVVPPAFAQHLADRIPQAHLTLVDGEGHFSLPLRRMEQILKPLLG